MLKSARSCAGELRAHATVNITMTDYCNLGTIQPVLSLDSCNSGAGRTSVPWAPAATL